MKVFHCDHCDHVVFFENVACVNCGHTLAYLPDRGEVAAMARTDDGTYRLLDPQDPGRYKLCANSIRHGVCNWAMAADDVSEVCASCRLTRVVPNLDVPGHTEAWRKLEIAKRRLVFLLEQLRLPLQDRIADPVSGLGFEFKADDGPNGDGARVLTGHDNGLITINVAEADDAEREKRRLAMHEPYRTLLGHFRHEIGHYYWDRLIRDPQRIDACRAVFGDESVDYAASLKQHYENGPPEQWQQFYISAYASTHPWEDWAETWAHYLHIIDALQTAGACGVSVDAGRPNMPVLPRPAEIVASRPFESIIESWAALSFVMNNLNRSLGQADGYPFVLTTQVLAKLRFVHDVIGAQDMAGDGAMAPAPVPVLAIPPQQTAQGVRSADAPGIAPAPQSDPATTVMAQLMQEQT